MKYAIVSTTTLPFDIPLLPAPTFLDGKLRVVYFKYPILVENEHALQITWKYRVFNGEQHLFTFIGESKFIIFNDGIPFIDAELDKFLIDLYLNYEVKWEERTKGTPLEGTTVSSINPNLPIIRQAVKDLLK